MENLIFYVYEFLTAFIPFFMTFILLNYLHKKRGMHSSGIQCAVIIIFAGYMIAVYHFTGAGTLYNGMTYQLELRKEQINLIPFSNEIDAAAYLLNILLFIPLGFFMSFLCGKIKKYSHMLGIGFAFSVFIEASQLLNNRRSDIDDIILNTLGAAVGFALYKTCRKFTGDKCRQGSVPVNELLIYIIVISAGRFLFYNEIGLAGLLYGF